MGTPGARLDYYLDQGFWGPYAGPVTVVHLLAQANGAAVFTVPSGKSFHGRVTVSAPVTHAPNGSWSYGLVAAHGPAPDLVSGTDGPNAQAVTDRAGTQDWSGSGTPVIVYGTSDGNAPNPGNTNAANALTISTSASGGASVGPVDVLLIGVVS